MGNGTLEQAFSFSNATRKISFAGEATVPADSVKWSINIDSQVPLAAGLSVTYLLRDIDSSSSSSYMTLSEVVAQCQFAKSAVGNITTYYLPLVSNSSAEVVCSKITNVIAIDVYDVALVDDSTYERINHSIVIVDDAASAGAVALVLVFPPFQSRLSYDPVLSLGTLLPSGAGSSNSDSNIGLIVGTVVGGTFAILIVGAIILASLIIASRRKIRKINTAEAVNFDVEERDD